LAISGISGDERGSATLLIRTRALVATSRSEPSLDAGDGSGRHFGPASTLNTGTPGLDAPPRGV